MGTRFKLDTLMYDNGSLRSEIEIPDGRDPNQNAWLTLTLSYSLNFADSRNPCGVVSKRGSSWFAKDSDGNFHPAKDWDFKTSIAFNRAFRGGEKIWNFQFLIETPQDYDALDYESMAGSGWLVRPNVLCLFRLVPSTTKMTHLPITVVRLDPSVKSKSFRSNVTLYDDLDVFETTLGHELGHALGQPHIKELKGDTRCIADAKRGIYPDRCYGETEQERANIMGGGAKLDVDNAKPWLDRIALHTGRRATDWKVSRSVNTPARKIPLGVALVGKPSRF